MQPQIPLPCLQQPAATSYPKPDETGPRPPTLYLHNPFQYYSRGYAQVY
jgi:hypothetical protein